MNAETGMGIAGSGSASTRRPASARVSARLAAALLDLLVGAAILVASVYMWAAFDSSGADGRTIMVPLYVELIAVSLSWLYLTAMSAAGATLGMRATGLRLFLAGQPAPPGLARSAIRSAILVAIVWLLGALQPFLIVAYPLLALFIPGRRLPHDLITATIVGTRPEGSLTVDPAVTRLAVGPEDARGLLAEMGDIRRRAARHLHPASVPLTVLGALAIAGGAVDLLDFTEVSSLTWLYWVAAGPAGLLITAWWYRRLRLRDGAGAGERDIVTIAILTGCAALIGLFLPLGGPITAVGFLAVAAKRGRSTALAIGSVIFGIVIGIEQPLHALSLGVANHLLRPDLADWTGRYGTTAIMTLLGAGLITAGVSIMRRERTG